MAGGECIVEYSHPPLLIRSHKTAVTTAQRGGLGDWLGDPRSVLPYTRAVLLKCFSIPQQGIAQEDDFL